MEKQKMETPDLTDKNIEQIAKLFPNVITETRDKDDKVKKAIDFDLLKQVLSKDLVEDDDERYRLDWPGKKASILKANRPITKTLRPCREESLNFDTTENLYLEGDNFEILKILQESYLGKIKMIYIDPPYNTGSDFIYKDDFKQTRSDYEEELGIEDEEGGKLFKNTDTNGRFHSDWLSMMYERLLIARDLLKNDGVVFTSIDDNEVTNLKKVCDEIFGEENFISLIAVENNPKGRKNSQFISVSNDYCLIYAKDKCSSYFIENIPKNINEMTKDENGNYVHKSGKRVLIGENSFNQKVKYIQSEKNYSVYYNNGINKICIKTEENIDDIDNQLLREQYVRYISQRNGKFIENTYTKGKFLELFNEKALEFKSDRIFEKNFNSVIRMKSILTNRKYDAIVNDGKQKYVLDVKTTSAGQGLKQLFNTDKEFFTAPKNTGLIKILASLFDDKNFTILDFFSGSATTAHAVMRLNAEDGGTRKSIMIQLPEETDEKSEAYKAGYKTISDIGKERIRRAGKKIITEIKEKNGKEPDNLDIGFRVYKTDTTNMKNVFYHPDEYEQGLFPEMESNIKEDRTPEDLLTQVILDLGLTLDLPMEEKEIKGNKVFIVQTNALVACFDKNINFEIIDEIAKLEPFKVVFKDACFKDDKDRINVSERFKRLSPETGITVI